MPAVRPCRSACNFAVGALALFACTSTTPEPREASPAAATPSAPRIQTASDAAGNPVRPSGWEIHEWGVLSVSAERLGHGRLVAGPAGTAPTPRIPSPMGRKKKPVLYVHLGKGVEDMTFSVEVAPTHGRVVEHWPRTPGASVAPTISWRDVRASTRACDGKRFAYPKLGDPDCAAPDGICEVAELAVVETADGVCLEVAGKTFEHLFYRADLDTLDLGIVIEPDGGQLRLANRGAAVLATALRVTSAGTRESTRVDRLDRIAPGAHILLPAPPTGASGTDIAGAIETLHNELIARGLTEDEADAFGRAWEPDLFGAVGAATASAAATDVVLVWLDPAAIEALVPLTITPAPTATRRTHLLVIEL